MSTLSIDMLVEQGKMPKHVAIIMDGNGRWAKLRGKHRTFGHKAGVDAVRAAVTFARKHQIKVLTLFAFSSENWQRPQDEVSILMDLFDMVLSREVKKLNKNDIRFNVIGDKSGFEQSLQEKIKQAEELTQNNTSLNLNIAANYGGRWDIVNAAKMLAEKAQSGHFDPNSMTEDAFSREICMSNLPELDLLIRTGGDHRLSNFMLWQAAYAELYFCDTLWPDFTEHAFSSAVLEYAKRQRRFGLTSEQLDIEAQGGQKC